MADFNGICKWLVYDLEDDHKHPGAIVALGDGAGLTRYGITSKNWGNTVPPEFFTTMSNEDAYVHAARIYYQAYFRGIMGDEITLDTVAASIFQFAVIHGVGSATRMLQRVLSVDPDGNFGPRTLAATNAAAAALLPAYQAAQLRYYRQHVLNVPRDYRFLGGWVARLQRVYPN